MLNILFLMPNLGHGGAEKVLINLVNHIDKRKFKVTIMTLYDEGINRQFINDEITYKACFKKSFWGISHVLKIFSPKQLYCYFIKDEYDIVISYLEGQTARIVSGCPYENTKKICWIHRTMKTTEEATRLFRNKSEAMSCYSQFDKIVSVSNDVQKAFMEIFPLEGKGIVLYNTNESDVIKKKSFETVENVEYLNEEFKMCAMGTLIPIKGFERLIHIHKQMKEKYPVHTYILGEGPDKEKLQKLVRELNVEDSVSFLGYQNNPYKHMAKCDLFVCSSYSEGFSTAVTEALILGLPVITTKVSGMEELLGQDNQYGIVVDNSEKALLLGIEQLIADENKIEYYKKCAELRGQDFNVSRTVDKVEQLFQQLILS